MTVWLVVFFLANGEQAEVASAWQPSKYECERERSSLDPDAQSKGWTTRCVGWQIPGNFRTLPSAEAAAEGGNCDNTQVLRRLQELKFNLDALGKSTDQVAATTRNNENQLRTVDSAVKRLDGAVRTLRCYRY